MLRGNSRRLEYARARLQSGVKCDEIMMTLAPVIETIDNYALAHHADIAQVQEWLERTNVSATRMYDKRRMRPEESSTLRGTY